MECHFCGVTEHQLWQHVRSRCPAAYLHLFHARALLLSNVSPAPRATLAVDGVLQDVRRRPQLQCTWDAHFMDDTITCDTLTLSGLWYMKSGAGQAIPTPGNRRRATVVSTLALPPLSFTEVFTLWAVLPFPRGPPNQPPPQPLAVAVRDPWVYAPWSHTLAASYLVRGLASWQVCSAGSLYISLPVEPSWHPRASVLLITCPLVAVYWALALLAEAEARPSLAGVALLAAVPPGDGTLPLPAPMTPYACGPLWLYTTAGVAPRASNRSRALTVKESEEQRRRLVRVVWEAEISRGPRLPPPPGAGDSTSTRARQDHAQETDTRPTKRQHPPAPQGPTTRP